MRSTSRCRRPTSWLLRGTKRWRPATTTQLVSSFGQAELSTWNELVDEFNAKPAGLRGQWLVDKQCESVAAIGAKRGNRHVVLYGSCFLQKPHVPPNNVSITHEDLNGFMSVIHGMTWDRGLTLVLHTPGGVTNATESIVAYLRSKFDDIEVIVPTLAMSAGTMISLAADRVVLGRQSQLGPIDPQMNMGGKSVSARAVVEQFDRAKLEILADVQTAHVWAPILQSLGPSLLQEAQNALDYSEQMVARWATDYMFKGEADAIDRGKAVARHFNDATTHKSHGRRIDRDEARAQGVVVEELEDDQDLQEAVLTAYHVMTIAFENGPLAKEMVSDTGRMWAKNFMTPEEAERLTAASQPPPATNPPGSLEGNRAQRRGNKRRR